MPGLRLKVLLDVPEPILVPWKRYQTDLTGLAYDTIASADREYARWLHEEGFRWKGRIYRLFVHSNVWSSDYRVTEEGMWIRGEAIWQLASPDGRLAKNFIEGIKRKGWEVRLFGRQFRVLDVVPVEHGPFPESMEFHTISPIVCSAHPREEGRPAIYLSPQQPEFIRNLEQNLIRKWEAFNQRGWEGEKVNIRVWEPRSKLVHVFGIDVRAWHLNAQMWGPSELIGFAYYAGLGERNSQGFGMLEIGARRRSGPV